MQEKNYNKELPFELFQKESLDSAMKEKLFNEKDSYRVINHAEPKNSLENNNREL